MRLKNHLKNIALTFVSGILILPAMAGNPDRSGQSGGMQLLINPYARSSGWGEANSACIGGLEAQYLNVAGISQTKGTELVLSHTNWLAGSGININTFGFSQHVGNSGAIAVGIMAMDFGKINVTTTDQPEGGIGTFSPQFINMSLSYAKEFSHSIYGGVNVKVLSENIANLKTQGVCFDAGIQYVTVLGKRDKEIKRDNVHFGISLKNVGPQMYYKGDGLAAKSYLVTTGAAQTLEFRSQLFDLPSCVNIGGAYDYYFSKENNNHRITGAFNFTSNSFIQDQFHLGAEYAFKSMFMVRAGMVYEKNLFNKTDRVTALTGPTAGFTAELPVNKKGITFAIDYSYRTTNPFSGCHAIGLRLKF